MTAVAHSLVTAPNPCGCRIIGTGTHTDPLRLFWCARHSVINDVLETAPLAKDARAMHESAKARSLEAETQLLRDIVTEIVDALPAIVGPPGSRTAGWAPLIPHVVTSDTGGRFGLAIGNGGHFYWFRPEDDRLPEDDCLTVHHAPDAEVLEAHGLHPILDALADALDAALGQKKAAEKIQKRVATMHAVMTLMRNGREK